MAVPAGADRLHARHTLVVAEEQDDHRQNDQSDKESPHDAGGLSPLETAPGDEEDRKIQQSQGDSQSGGPLLGGADPSLWFWDRTWRISGPRQ